jgi:integrase
LIWPGHHGDASNAQTTAQIIDKRLPISIEHNHVFQNPRDVKTKLRKTIDTFYYPVGDDVVAIVRDWVTFLTTEKLFGPDDPLFPKTMVRLDAQRNFCAQGLGREHWVNATAVRKIFRTAFERVGLPYVNPHSVRNTLTQFAYTLRLTPEQFKAWSQNMGHDKPLTTLNSYGHVSIERQAEIIRGLRHQQPTATPDDVMAEKIAEKVAAIMRAQGQC